MQFAQFESLLGYWKGLLKNHNLNLDNLKQVKSESRDVEIMCILLIDYTF